ncbi:MAG: PD-(D/E)XK motif protein [Bacteroidales bacterium]|nr:PD-(D/E)XK motif protein [Bacteroidales bacterium]
MTNLYSTFCRVKPAEGQDKCFSVEKIASDMPHRLGCSQEGHPIFFVECNDETPTTNISLKLFSVNFNQLCKLHENDNNIICKKYTIILLKSQEIDLQKYFLDLIYIVLKKLTIKPNVNSLKHEISKVISLFTSPPAFSKEVVKGLWSELFVIAKSKDPLYLINAWHTSPEDKYDFNDGIDKIEVKATNNHERIHTFSLEQLNPNKGSGLIIVSIIFAASGIGANIFDLIDCISMTVTDADALLKLKEITYQTIGPNLEEAKKVRFDTTMAANTYMLFNHYNIPAISSYDIPAEVSNVHFTSCLKDVPAADISVLDSKLHKAL